MKMKSYSDWYSLPMLTSLLRLASPPTTKIRTIAIGIAPIREKKYVTSDDTAILLPTPLIIEPKMNTS
jgi:hypothetical protein